MQWKYEPLVQEHQLVYKTTVLARIQMSHMKRGGFKVVSLISGIYFGMQLQKKLEKQKKQWVAYRKKFADREAANQYIERKKNMVLKFVQAREKEA